LRGVLSLLFDFHVVSDGATDDSTSHRMVTSDVATDTAHGRAAQAACCEAGSSDK
jgi:hypothetical protein